MLIYFAALAVAALLTLRRPGAAGGVLFCTYGLEQWAQSQNQWFFTHNLLTNSATASLILLAIVVRLKQGRPVLRDLGRDYWIVVGLASYMLASTTWSVAPTETIAIFQREGPYFIVFAFLFPLTISDRHDLRDALYALVTMGTALVLLLLFTSHWNQRSIVMDTGSSFFLEGINHGNPLAIADLGGAVAITMGLLNFSGAGRLLQIVRYAIVLVAFALTVKSGSRGQAVAIVIVLVAMVAYGRRVRSVGSFVGFAVAAVIVAYAGTKVFEAYGTDGRWSFDNSVTDMRNARLGASLVLLSHWTAGGPLRWLIGLGSSASFGLPDLGFYPHVVAAESLGELGIVGLGWFCTITYFVYQNARDLWPFVRDEPITRGLIACIVGLCFFNWIVGWKEGSFLGSYNLFGLSAVLGRVAISIKREAAEHAEADAAGYAMTDEERLLEDEAYLDELCDPEPVGSRG